MRRLLFVLFLLSPSPLATANPAVTSLKVEYHPDRGVEAFDFYIASNASYYWAKYQAPDGTELDNYEIVSGLSAAELTARFSGTWSIISRTATLPQLVELHSFTIESFEVEDIAPTPSILSPAEGAFLPAIFDIDHTGSSYLLRSEKFVVGTEGGRVNINVASLLPAIVDAWATTSVGFVVGNATASVPNPYWKFAVNVNKTTYSPPRTWTIGVPEPTSAMIASLAFVALALRRRK
jgi:hypothetical protein